ncbi:hypothetical protein FNW25_01430 [Flavobacterium franklandianum]|uniref:hypothetical protein n=1 Tax=Flavobacterium franklandianum TaxID=2594430 RepID=UPI001179C329|nr:hypothetical protein [Flavobacterium franklandianum]TRX29648.1 hypothetical protein FNW25_01430 [Flavobacterium franklandianum]
MSGVLARGIRNKNPGNLVLTNIAWFGKISGKNNTDGKFEQFETIEYGIRAMFKDLVNDINKGKNTVRKLINEYAPPSENNTTQYIKDVSQSIGVKADDVITSINQDFLLKLGKAIIRKENGSDASKITDAQIIKGMKMMGDVSTAVLKVNVKSNKLYYVVPLLLLFYTVFTVTL